MRNTNEEYKKVCDELIERNLKLIRENKELQYNLDKRFGGIKLVEDIRAEIKRLQFIIEQGQKLCTTYEDTIEEHNDTIKGLQEELQISYKCHEDECDNHEDTKVRHNKLQDIIEHVYALTQTLSKDYRPYDELMKILGEKK